MVMIFMNNNVLGALTAAYIGDAVYELKMRVHFHNHKDVVKRVCAESQAIALDKIYDLLTEEEIEYYKRGRNAKVNSVPQHASVAQYHKATGLESLFGYLYNSGNNERIDELFEIIITDD